jgi:hypothetical protein
VQWSVAGRIRRGELNAAFRFNVVKASGNLRDRSRAKNFMSIRAHSWFAPFYFNSWNSRYPSFPKSLEKSIDTLLRVQLKGAPPPAFAAKVMRQVDKHRKKIKIGKKQKKMLTRFWRFSYKRRFKT